MRLAGLLFLLFSCDSTPEYEGEYSGGGQEVIVEDGQRSANGISRRMVVRETPGGVSIELSSGCIVPFVFTTEESARATVGASCTIDPEVDGGTTYGVTSGTATFVDTTLGVQLVATRPGGSYELSLGGDKR